MRAQWVGALVGAIVMLAVLVVVAGLYVLYTKSSSGAAPDAADNVPPTTIQNMALEAQFKGPLKDTVIQRWKDPQTGTTCYIYLPVVVQHSQPTPTGFVQYGANGIGSISCLRRP